MPEFEEASPICRGKNVTWETVLLFYNNMPRESMPKSQFNSYTEARLKGWTQTHSQIARQLALYYEEDGICYPRFTKNISYSALLLYMQNWASKYFIPNPFTPSLKDFKPTCIYSAIVNAVKSGNSDFKNILDSILGVELNNKDKVRAYLNSFTDLIIEDDQVSINDRAQGLNTVLHPDSDCVSDYKKYFDYFSAPSYGIDSRHGSQNEWWGINALRTKPFLLLAGISGTGKSRKVLELAYHTCARDGKHDSDPTSPGNYMLIPVKPNWHDSTELLGYYSSITGKYVLTDFIRFVWKAWMNKDVPYFLCLDEMNLAPVEQYFAEYLSILETRKLVQDVETKKWEIVSAELLPKKTFEGIDPYKKIDIENTDDDGVRTKDEPLYQGEDLQIINFLKQNGLRLPENLFVIGTVNMDDTTHQFSRKVIDRAFTIEMNGDDLEKMFDAEDTLVYQNKPMPLDEIRPYFVQAKEFLEALPVDADIIKKYVPEMLNTINGEGIFKDTPFRVSYRVQNEMILYYAAIRPEDDLNDDQKLAYLQEAFMAVLLEKVLPRVEGDEKAMRCDNNGDSVILMNLKNYIVGMKPEDGDPSPLYKTLIDKLDEMNARVKNSYFTSFFS